MNYNSKRFVQQQKCKLSCSCQISQSQSLNTLGKNITICNPISCNIQSICSKNSYKFQKYIQYKQNLYSLMRIRPELFPIITSAKEIGLSLKDQRRVSNNWYRQFGTSNSLSVNDNWGGFYLQGSDVPFTN